MKQEVEINVLNLDGKDYLLLDNLIDKEKNYYYFSNIKDTSDVMVLTDGEGEKYISVDDRTELNYALSLFYDKYRENDSISNA